MAEFKLFVCGDGNIVGEDDLTAIMNLNESEPDFDVPLFAIKNLGMVNVVSCNSAIGVTFHPRNVEPAALDAAILFLSSTAARFYRIRYLADSWREEIVASPSEASARIFELCSIECLNATQPTRTADPFLGRKRHYG